MMYGFGFPGMWLGGVAMMLLWVVVLVAVIWAVVYASRRAARPGPVTPRGETPLDILERRFALGEINKEQFEEAKHNLAA